MINLKNWKNFSEGSTYKSTKKPHETKVWDTDKKETFRGKLNNHIKSQNCKSKKIGNDLELYCNDKHIAQIMFRDNYVGIKKVGDRFTNEFSYNELGRIKTELTNIIKSCK